jgi:large subunit ribosomal protein L36e
VQVSNNLQLGTFGRAKAKVEDMNQVIAESRRAAH